MEKVAILLTVSSPKIVSSMLRSTHARIPDYVTAQFRRRKKR
jgi:hypothetical protein